MKELFFILSLISMHVQSQSSDVPVQPFIVPQLIKQQWNKSEGLPIADINSMVQDDNGYIWLAGLSGLTRFDGHEFTQYDTSNSQFPSNRLTTIRKSEEVLWLSSDEGHLVRFALGRAKTMQISDGMPHNRVVRVTPKEDYGLAYGTLEGVVLVQGKNITAFPLNSNEDEITAIHWPSRDLLWVNTESWLYQIKDPLGDKLIQRWPFDPEVWMVTTFQDRLWLGTYHGVYLFTGDGFQRQYTEQIKGKVVMVQVTQTGDLLIGADRLWRISNDEITEITKPNSIELQSGSLESTAKDEPYAMGLNKLLLDKQILTYFNSEISDGLVGKDGGIWMVSKRQGLFRYQQSNLQTIAVDEGLTHTNLYPIFQASDQTVWIGAADHGAYQLSDSGKLLKSIKGGDLARSITEIDGTIWLAGNSLCMLAKTGACEILDQELVLKDAPFNLTYQDSQDRVWLSGRLGSLWVREQGHWQRMGVEHNWHATTKVQTVMESENGDLWFGTNGDGLIQFRNNTVISTAAQWGLKSMQIRSLLMLDESQLLVGTEDQGLCLIQLKTSSSGKCINSEHNFASISVHHMHLDSSQRLWWSSNQGVFWQQVATLMAVFDGGLEVLPSGGRYDERNGMRNSEANGGVFPVGLADNNNQLWYPTQEGLVIFNLSDQDQIPPARAIIQSINSLKINDGYDQPSISLNKEQRSIQVKLTALSYYDPAHIEFRYRFTNESTPWVQLGQNRLASISNLAKGLHTMEFSARNKGGDWQSEPSKLSIDIKPYWYETSLAKLMFMLILLMIIVVVFRWRNREIMQKAHKLELLVNERTTEIKQMSEKRSEFFANISHELRTPLTLILGPMEDVLTDDQTLSKTDIKLVHNSAQRMKRLVDQMLDLQKMDAGKLQLHKTSEDLVYFIKSCIEPFELLAKRLNIKLNFKDLSPESLTSKMVSIDPLQMEKVFGNLLSNAFKFTPENSKIDITIELAGSELVSININDEGPGFDPTAEKRLFNRFSQELSTGQKIATQGTGIGLALVKEITELHGGQAIAKNRTTGGASFRIVLPFYDQKKDQLNTDKAADFKGEIQEFSVAKNIHDSIPDIQTVNPLQNQPELDWNNDQVKILIVEDNSDLRHYIASHLQAQYQLIFAEDGQLGLKASRRHLPDIIISDVMMPNMNGFEMATALRKDPITDFIPFLFLTARLGIEDELHGLSLGADDYITKPFSGALLKARINAILKARERLKHSINQDSVSNPNKTSPKGLKEKSLAIISAHYSDPEFGVAALADHLFMSRSKLHRQLKSQYNTSASELLRSVRMQQAKKLIQQNAGNVSEVCCAVGYTNLSSFSNIFHDTFGERPSTKKS